jgi:hypothetical protein
MAPLTYQNQTYYFKQTIPEGELKQKLSPTPLEQEKADQWLVCTTCLHSITKHKNSTTVNSKHMHRFVNPEGFYFEIRCFNQAPGCKLTGESTADFTWFPGFEWQLALCGNCSMHLGWKYTRTDSIFYGLIQDRLIELESGS